MKRWTAIIALGMVTLGFSAYGASSAPAVDMDRPIHYEGKAVSLDVADTEAAQAVSIFSQNVGATIILNDPVDKKVTLKFKDYPLSRALDKLGTELDCKWQRRYILFKKEASTASQERHPSGKLVSMELSNTDLQIVSKMIAKAAGGVVVVQDGLSGKVSLKAENTAVEQAFDTICSSIGADWKVEYLFSLTAEAKAKAEQASKKTEVVTVSGSPKEEEEPTNRVVSKQPKHKYFIAVQSEPGGNDDLENSIPAGPRAFPNPQPVVDFFGNGKTPEQSTQQMTARLGELFGRSYNMRKDEITSLASKITSLAEYMNRSNQKSRDQFVGTLRPGMTAMKELLNQQTPDHQKELKPLIDAIDKMLNVKTSKK